MSTKKPPTKKQLTELEALEQSQRQLASCFHLIAEANFPGNQSHNVAAALKYLDALHTEATQQIEKLKPVEQAEVKKEESVNG